MNPVVYEFTSYKKYLDAWLAAQPKAGHGQRRRMAQHIGTQTGFITQVLSGEAHFSPEQIFAVSQMLGHGPEEADFLELLLRYERAGNTEYRHHVSRQMQKILKERKVLSQRLKAQTFPSEVDQYRYFSSWLYACLHVMATCEVFQTSRLAMAKALNLPLEVVAEKIEFLLSAGLIQEQNGRLVAGQARLHLGTDSPYLADHHRNWNMLAMQKIATDLKSDLHYSSVVSLSRPDYEKVKEIFMQAIEDSKKIVRSSDGEKVYASAIHFFEVC